MERITRKLIAPCGMNCGLCVSHLRDENKCPGCLSGKKIKGACAKCSRKLCKERKGNYCFECDKFPCRRLKQLDKRYREKYDMSEIKNLEYIKKYGIDKFVKKERKRWQKGDKVICVHNKKEY